MMIAGNHGNLRGAWRNMEEHGGHFAKSPGNLKRVQNGQGRAVQSMLHGRIK